MPRTTSIWWFALGYFAAYVPYSALTKALTSNQGAANPLRGLELLPSTAIAGTCVAFAYLAISGAWRAARQISVGGRTLPWPRRQTVLSGLCASGIIATTTLAYTFTGVSLVFVMMLMRGGMLLLAPIIDIAHRHPIAWYSWLALGLTLLALGVVSSGGDATITAACALDIAVYLACYALRLSLMSRAGKSLGPQARRAYFVEEQLISTPALLAGLGVAAVLGHQEIRAGFFEYWQRPGAWLGLVIGGLSQLTGIFGGLILLDAREHSFSVPVNRASSVFAGVAAAALLGAFGVGPWPALSELLAAGIVTLAVTTLALGPRLSFVRTNSKPPR